MTIDDISKMCCNLCYHLTNMNRIKSKDFFAFAACALMVVNMYKHCYQDFTRYCSYTNSVRWANYTGWAKKVSLLIFAIALSTASRFS